MVNRLISVGDDFTLPAAVKTTDANLPAASKAAAISANLADNLTAAKTYTDTGLAGKENATASGTAEQYRRGDKTWQTLNSAAIPDLKITHITPAKVLADAASTYPTGVSYFGTSEAGWPVQFGNVHTVRWSAGRTTQTYTTTTGRTFTRIETGGGPWTAFTELSAVGHTHTSATTTVAGFMSAADKTKLDEAVTKQAVKCIRLEAGAWVWDLAAGTHYLIPDHAGALIARATPWPVPNPTTKTLDW